MDEYYRPLYERLGGAIRAGIARSEFRDVDPQQTVLTLVAMLVFYFRAVPAVAGLWRCGPLNPSQGAARRRAVLDFLEHGLFASSTRAR